MFTNARAAAAVTNDLRATRREQRYCHARGDWQMPQRDEHRASKLSYIAQPTKNGLAQLQLPDYKLNLRSMDNVREGCYKATKTMGP